MQIRILFAKAVRRMREAGVLATLRGGVKHLTRDRRTDDFDRLHGTDTGIAEPLWELEIQSENAKFGNSYQATDEQELLDAMRLVHEDPQTFTFIDVGCGKGRPLLVASKLGFREIFGVEFARNLVEIARTNLSRLGITNAVVQHGDAAEFRFPAGDVVLYLYNPFSQEVLQRVLDNLKKADLQKLFVIYKMPTCAGMLDRSGLLTRLGSPPDRPNIGLAAHGVAAKW